MTDKLLLEHVHVLDLIVHLVNIFGWMIQGGHSEQLLLLALYYQRTPSCLKVRGGWGGCPCDFSVSPDSQTLGLWTLDLGLTIALMHGIITALSTLTSKSPTCQFNLGLNSP